MGCITASCFSPDNDRNRLPAVVVASSASENGMLRPWPESSL